MILLYFILDMHFLLLFSFATFRMVLISFMTCRFLMSLHSQHILYRLFRYNVELNILYCLFYQNEEQLLITFYIAFLISYDLSRNHFIWHDGLRHGMMPCKQINVCGRFESGIYNNFNRFLKLGPINVLERTL